MLLIAAAIGAALWWRKNPSACPYSQRFWVDAPHPLITRERLRDVLAPADGERVLELGPGTGYYTLELARWLGAGKLDIFDIQQEMLDHTMGRVQEAGLGDAVTPRRGDGQDLPYEDESFDAAVLITVLGEIPDRERAVGEIARVLRPGGRLVVGELFGDPHYQSPRELERLAGVSGLALEHRSGPAIGYFARLRRPD